MKLGYYWLCWTSLPFDPVVVDRHYVSPVTGALVCDVSYTDVPGGERKDIRRDGRSHLLSVDPIYLRPIHPLILLANQA